jgi:hypothetical protein
MQFATLKRNEATMFRRNLIYLLETALLLVVVHPANAAPATSLAIQSCFPLYAPCPFVVHTLGQPFSIWVFAVDANNQLATNYLNTVSIGSTADVTLPPPHAFTAADNAAFAFTMTVNSLPAGSDNPAQVPVTATDASALTGNGLLFVAPALPLPPPAPSLSAAMQVSLGMLLGLLALLSLRARRRSNH